MGTLVTVGQRVSAAGPAHAPIQQLPVHLEHGLVPFHGEHLRIAGSEIIDQRFKTGVPLTPARMPGTVVEDDLRTQPEEGIQDLLATRLGV